MYFPLFFLFNIANFLKKSDYNFNKNYIFSNVLDLHLQYIYKYNMTDISLKKDFAIKTSSVKNAKMYNFYFKNSMFRKIRFSCFKSDDKQIFSSVWYPSYDYECPILSIDMINYNQNKSLFLTNLYEIYNKSEYYNDYIKEFVEIKNKYSELSETPSENIVKYNNVFKNSILFSSNCDDNLFQNEIIDVLCKYFNNYFLLFRKRPVNRQHIEEKHYEYNKIRMYTNLDFFIKDYFDDEWYKFLLYEYYYH